MKITRKQLNRIIKESFNKYGQPVQSSFQGKQYTNYGQRDRNVPNETTKSYVWAFNRWAKENLEQDTWNLMGSDNSFQVFLPGRQSISIRSSETSGLDVYHQDQSRKRIDITSVDHMLEILDEKVHN